jgi:catalase
MTDPLAHALVESFDAIFGSNPGARAAHAKGTSCDATFVATPAAASLTRALHLQGDPIPAIVRFSNGSGNPAASDSGREPRGMSVKFHLPDGNATDLVAINHPVFIVRTPEEFLEFMRLRAPDPATGQPDFAKLIEFVSARPESQRAAEILLNAPPIASFLRANYFPIHAYRFIAPDRTERAIRYRWESSLGIETLTTEEAAARDPDYLRADLLERLSRGPVTFTLTVQIAGPDDDPSDPTTEWPDDRDRITIGHLEIGGPCADQAATEAMVFDPMRLCDGIRASKDPVLKARARAYLVSSERRLSPAP